MTHNSRLATIHPFQVHPLCLTWWPGCLHHRQGGRKESGATLLKKAEASTEEQAKDMEKKVHELLEQSALLTSKADHAAGKQGALQGHTAGWRTGGREMRTSDGELMTCLNRVR